MITYQVEKWQDCKDEMSYLWPKHWVEVAVNRDKVPLDPDYAEYQRLQDIGSLHIMTVRSEGKIVGYHFTIIRPHLHYKSTLMAFTDIYFLDKEYRKGFAALKLFREVEKSLRARGVKVMVTGTKVSLDMSVLFKRLRWNMSERLFTKYVGD